MSDKMRQTLIKRGVAAAVAASLFTLVQGCATQPAQSRVSSDYAPAESDATAAAPAGRGPGAKHGPHHEANPYFRTTASTTDGSVTVEGHDIHYHAVAGMLIVHPAGWNDAKDQPAAGDPGSKSAQHDHGSAHKPPEASMFYVAYFKDGEKPGERPITFLYNGGPGSSTVWLHMGAFGPRRVVTADHTHTPPAPYQLVNNDYSLLDASDLVFVDAPGTGFSRVTPGAEKDFLGADQDVHAFSEFIMQFLSKYGRWNSPKYLFGESYGTPRSANLINVLETKDDTDFNGVILLSQILNYDDSPGRPRYNPGVDQGYELALPTYAATAWYHHKLPKSGQSLQPLLTEVEQFALGDYAQALHRQPGRGMSMSDAVRSKLALKGFSALAAAGVFALVQGCATQPTQSSQAPAGYAQPSAGESGSADGMQDTQHSGAKKAHHHEANPYFRTATSTTEGSVAVEGHTIHYHAVAGMLIVHPAGWNDAAGKSGGDDPPQQAPGHGHGEKKKSPEASMFYVAYFKDGEKPGERPITFLYNGGPGSSTVWLHMGAFGPRRVVTADHTHTPPAPYQLVNNDYSLLDASDLVFVDAPGTGFSRVTPGAEKDFFGADQDVHAFSGFIMQFLSRYGRWNSPKYLFGESYGTPRSANLINVLETKDDTDFNGVILLSQVLNFNGLPDLLRGNPGIDLAYELALPTYAATAWYHHKLPKSGQSLQPLLTEVEQFALGDYAQALRAGSTLSPGQRDAVAAKLHDYTGLPVAYIKKADLRIDGGQFEHSLQGDADLTTGRLDSRFSGPSLDPLSERAEYDPQSASISSAYVSAFNNYVRASLHYGMGMRYKPTIGLFRTWNYQHQPPGAPFALPQALNVLPDLANAMKYNPNLKVMLNGGYFDVATPFYEGMYEMAHLPMPKKLQANIEYHYYESGHMVYAHTPSLKELHDNVAAFIANTEHQQAGQQQDGQ